MSSMSSSSSSSSSYYSSSSDDEDDVVHIPSSLLLANSEVEGLAETMQEGSSMDQDQLFEQMQRIEQSLLVLSASSWLILLLAHEKLFSAGEEEESWLYVEQRVEARLWERLVYPIVSVLRKGRRATRSRPKQKSRDESPENEDFHSARLRSKGPRSRL